MRTKNIFKALALAMLMPAMLLTTACSNEDDVVNTSYITNKGYALPVTVNVTRQDDGVTRATYTESTGKLAFSAGDKLLVRGNDESVGGAGRFAGMLDYDTEKGNFSGTIYTQNEYSGTADALFTAATANWVGAALFPNGYESYQFLSISGSGYSTSYSMSYNKAIAATKAAAVEQFSLETAKTYSSGFTLAPENAILNFTITGLTDGAKDVTLKNESSNMFSGSVTPTSGTAAFALGAMIKNSSDWPVNLKNVTLTIGGTDIDITDANNYLTAGTIYNITRSAAPTYTLLSAATTADYGKVVCAAGHLHDAKTAVPTGCTAVGILGKVTETGHGLILALQDAPAQKWNTINGWTSVTTYAGTTLKQLPAGALGGLTSYATLGSTTVSDWCVAQKSDYEAIFINLGSAKHDDDGYTYDDNVNAYITTDVGGTAISGDYWSATEYDVGFGRYFNSDYWYWYNDSNGIDYSLRPVLGF